MAHAAIGGQPTNVGFFPVDRLKPYTDFLGFDRDKQDLPALQAALQNSGTNWHCNNDTRHMICPLSGDQTAPGSFVSFRAPHKDDSGATVSEFRVTLSVDDAPALQVLRPESPAVNLLGQDWGALSIALGKPTNVYDDGSTIQRVYCAASDPRGKPGEPKTARVYLMYVDISHATNEVSAVELSVIDQVVNTVDPRPTC